MDEDRILDLTLKPAPAKRIKVHFVKEYLSANWTSPRKVFDARTAGAETGVRFT